MSDAARTDLTMPEVPDSPVPHRPPPSPEVPDPATIARDARQEVPQASAPLPERPAPPAPTRTAEGDVYEVFSRFREDELHHIGSVVAAGSELAQMYAGELYDEWRWAEMRLIRRDKLIPIIEVR